MSRFCEACPLKLKSLPLDPCHEAMKRLEWQKDTKNQSRPQGCPWAIKSEAHSYCFWSFAQDLEESMSDRDIALLLDIDQASVSKTYHSAIAKLQANIDSPEIQAFVQTVYDKMHTTSQFNNTIPDSRIRVPITHIEEPDPEGAKKKKKLRKGLGMPLHWSGNKVDLYGLYTNKKPDQPVGKKRGKAKKSNKT